MTNIRNAAVKRVLNELAELSAKDRRSYETFYARVPQAAQGRASTRTLRNREQLLELLRFKSTTQDGWTSLAEYKARMKADQKAIYYITGDNEATLRSSPLLEVYRDKGIEVLLLDDEIDELVMPAIGKYKDTELRSVNRAGAADDLRTEGDRERERRSGRSSRRSRKRSATRSRTCAPRRAFGLAVLHRRRRRRPHGQAAADLSRHGPGGHRQGPADPRDQPRSRDREEARESRRRRGRRRRRAGCSSSRRC